MTNQPATASQKTDEVANKTTPSVITDTIFSGTGFSPLQCVAMEREHSCPQHPLIKSRKVTTPPRTGSGRGIYPTG